MHVAVIASMKRGLEHFIYREMLAFSKLGVRVSLFPTKFQTGLYNARPEWTLHRWNLVRVLLDQPRQLARQPMLYLRLLFHALSMGALVELLLAWHFAPKMADADAIYATFGDRKLFVGYFCKLILGKPLAVEIQAYELYQNPNPRLFTRALAACDRVISTTEYNREQLVSRFGVDPSRMEVVRFGIDADEYRPGRKFALLIVAFFVERKGHEILFEAIRLLDRDDVEVWVVGGEGAEQPVDVQALAKQHGVDSKVAFFGKLGGTSLKALYRSCDAFCLPSRQDRSGVSEGFPAAIIEAMAFGKPVISTYHVEIPRVLDEVLVPENDAPALARAIERVCGDAELRRRLGEKNRQLALDVFSSRNPERTVRILESLAGCPGASPGGSTAGAPRRVAAFADGASPRA